MAGFLGVVGDGWSEQTPGVVVSKTCFWMFLVGKNQNQQELEEERSSNNGKMSGVRVQNDKDWGLTL